MSGDGGGSQTQDAAGQPIAVDHNNLAEFMKTGQGQQYAGSYIPGASYYQSHTDSGEVVKAYAPGFNGSASGGGSDASAMMAAYTAWTSGMSTTKANWQNYADTAAKFEGGQGDQTITSGAAVSQRSVLLGSLSGVGGQSQTPSLGSLGAVTTADALAKVKGGVK